MHHNYSIKLPAMIEPSETSPFVSDAGIQRNALAKRHVLLCNCMSPQRNVTIYRALPQRVVWIINSTLDFI
jgi:hypothetical protein